MPVAIRTITQIQDADDANLTLNSGTDGYAITWDNATGKFVMAEAGGSSLPVVDETALVYKTGNASITATFDANSLTTARTYTLPDVSSTVAVLGTAQTFTAGQTVNVSSTTALKVEQSSNNTFVVDTTNKRVGIGTGSPAALLEVFGNTSGTIRALIRNTNSAGDSRLIVRNNNSVEAGFLIAGSSAIVNANQSLFYCNNAIKFMTNNTVASGGTTGDISFYAGGSNVTPQLVVRASGNGGNVGIGGVTTPSAQLHVLVSDFITNAVTDIAILAHIAAGTAAAGFGAGLKFTLKSSTTNDQDAARLVASWSTATHASRAADLIGYASDYGGEREIWRGRASGTAAQFAVLGATPVSRQAHIADPSGGSTVDTEARTAINSILAALESFGFLATS